MKLALLQAWYNFERNFFSFFGKKNDFVTFFLRGCSFAKISSDLRMVSWPVGRSITCYVEEGRGSYEQSAGESQDGAIYR